MPVLTHTFPAAGYAVIHDGNGFVQFHACAAGSEISTGQPHLETFSDEEEATARAIELGYSFPAPEDDPLALPLPEPPPEAP